MKKRKVDEENEPGSIHYEQYTDGLHDRLSANWPCPR